MEWVFGQINVVKSKLNNRMGAELVNTILNIRTGLKRNNIIMYVIIMTEILEAMTMWSFIGTSLVCNESNTAEGCVTIDNCDCFCRIRFQFAYSHIMLCSLCVYCKGWQKVAYNLFATSNTPHLNMISKKCEWSVCFHGKFFAV